MIHQDTCLSDTRAWLWHTCGQLLWPWWPGRPGPLQAGELGHSDCTLGCTPVFPVPGARPLRLKRGVTQKQTPSGMTQIQPLAEPLPPGPTTFQASGGEVRGSRDRGGNSPGASPLPKQCLACDRAHRLSLRMWSTDFVSCRDRQERAIPKLLTQQMRATDNSRPWWLLAPQQAVIPTEAGVSKARLLPAPCPFHTHALGNYLGAHSSTKPR